MAATGIPSEKTRTITEWSCCSPLVSADDVVIQHRLYIPALLFRHLREMLASVQSLFLPSYRQKNDRCRKFQFAQHAGALQAHRGSTGVIVRPGSIAVHVERVAVPGIIMSGHQYDRVSPSPDPCP